MIKQYLLILLSLLWITPAYALESSVPQVSLFLTPQETFEASMLARRLPPERKGEIHLGAVLYYGQDDWTLWLQGQKWTPETIRSDIRILEVTANDVRLSIREEHGTDEKIITLKPNQSFEIATGKIIGSP
ncbi:MAG: hypothetical protein WC464_06380 [Bdellovibrionales bacterium]